MKRKLLSLLKLLGCAYLIIIFLAVIFQRSLLFKPAAEGLKNPSDFGAKFETISIPSPTGISRFGWFVHDPLRSSATPRPILVYCQGNAGNLADRAKVASLFASLGLDAVMISYRGYGNSGFKNVTPTEASIYEDAQAAYDFALARVPENRILVWGHSLGAAPAAYLGSTDHPAGVILESPFTSVADMVPVKYPWLLVPSFMILDKFPTIEFAKKLHAPLLVLVAAKDSIIPPRFGEAVFQAAHEPKTFVSLVDTDHSQLPDNFEHFRPQISEFLKSIGFTGARAP